MTFAPEIPKSDAPVNVNFDTITKPAVKDTRAERWMDIRLKLAVRLSQPWSMAVYQGAGITYAQAMSYFFPASLWSAASVGSVILGYPMMKLLPVHQWEFTYV